MIIMNSTRVISKIPRLHLNLPTTSNTFEQLAVSDTEYHNFEYQFELRTEIKDLENAIAIFKENAEEERNRIITSYKELIQEIGSYWKERIKNLKNKNTSEKVIVINDSSDSENEKVFEISDSSEGKTSIFVCNRDYAGLQKEVDEIKRAKENNENDLDMLKSANLSLEEEVKIETDFHQQLKLKYKTEMNQLCQQTVAQNDKVFEYEGLYSELLGVELQEMKIYDD